MILLTNILALLLRVVVVAVVVIIIVLIDLCVNIYNFLFVVGQDGASFNSFIYSSSSIQWFLIESLDPSKGSGDKSERLQDDKSSKKVFFLTI